MTDLNEVVETIRNLHCLTDVSSEFRNLGHILGHLSVVKEHIDREEDVIFPYLRKAGWAKLCQSALNEHGKIRIDIDNLLALMISFNEIGFDDFKGWLITIVHRFSPLVREHLSYENELLYPISLLAIDDPNVWLRIKALCDEIGYCGAYNPLY
jgi:hemerythrin-like domain-containing protein